MQILVSKDFDTGLPLVETQGLAIRDTVHVGLAQHASWQWLKWYSVRWSNTVKWEVVKYWVVVFQRGSERQPMTGGQRHGLVSLTF